MKIEVDQYKLIRNLHTVKGKSQRYIARVLGLSRNTVKKYCDGASVPWERKAPVRKSPVITNEVLEFINHCLEEDQNAPRKQRHTAHRIFERLREELGYQGGESTVRYRVAQLRKNFGDVYIPLFFGPAEATQVDWGTATVIMNGQRVEVQLFCIRLCYSCAPFVVAFPSQREEAFFEGHILAFTYFGGVTLRCIYDNLKTAVKEGFGRYAKEQESFHRFSAHYAFEASFCNVREGHEKSLVENLVGWARRNILVPIPEVKDFTELNAIILERCRQYLNHTIRGREESVGELLRQEQKKFLPLPKLAFDPAKLTEPEADHYATVAFDGNRYSVPVKLAGETLTVKGYARTVKIYHHGEEVAVHERLYQKGRTSYQLHHYLSLLEVRPRAVWNAKPVQQANLPDCLSRFSKASTDPDRVMVHLLRLSVDEGLERVADAVERTLAVGSKSVQVVEHYLNQEKPIPRLDVTGPSVEPPDLGRYDLLLGGERQ